MIKVLHKAFEVLRLVAQHEGPVLPSAVAKALDMNLPTTTRILRELVQLGCLEQTGTRQGYQLSMEGWAIFSRHPLVSRLMAEGSTLISQYAQDTRQCFFLSVVRSGRRYTIFYRNCHPQLNLVPQRIVYEDCHITAAGQLLLALSDDSTRRSYLQSLPAQVDRRTLAATFTRIRTQGYCFQRRKVQFHAIAAYPVYRFDKPVAAVSVCMVGEDLARNDEHHLIQACQSCAAEISVRLGVNI